MSYKTITKRVGYICPKCRKDTGIRRTFQEKSYIEVLSEEDGGNKKEYGVIDFNKDNNTSETLCVQYKEYKDVSLHYFCNNCEQMINLIEIDEELIEIIELLNSINGVRTAYCCSGHGKEEMYIKFYSNWDDYLYNCFVEKLYWDENDENCYISAFKKFRIYREQISDQRIYEITMTCLYDVDDNNLADVTKFINDFKSNFIWLKSKLEDIKYFMDYNSSEKEDFDLAYALDPNLFF